MAKTRKALLDMMSTLKRLLRARELILNIDK